MLGCRNEWVWAVRKRVEAVGVGSCTHSWLIYNAVLKTCIRIWLIFADSRVESICMRPITVRGGCCKAEFGFSLQGGRVEGAVAGE